MRIGLVDSTVTKNGRLRRKFFIEAKMTLLGVSPMLTVVALGPAIEFYRDVLGFQCLSQAQGWACMSLDGVEVMFALPNQHLPVTAR